MKIIEEHYVDNYRDIRDLCWSGALDTLDDIENADLEEEFIQLLEVNFEDGATDTEINDFIWHDRDFIYEQLGLDENGQVVEDEEEFEEEI